VYVVTPTYTNNSVGCNGNTANVTITVNPLPVYTGTTSQTICSSQATSLSLTANTTGGTNTFAWTSASVSGISGNVVGSGSSIAQTLTNSNLTPTNAVYSIQSTFTNNSVACNNTTNGSATVTVNPRPTASAGGSVTICSGQSTQVTGATANNGSISWAENGAGFISAGGTTLTPTYTSDALDAGNTVTLTMTVTGSGICVGQTATATYSVNVNPSPTPTITGPATSCGYTNGTYSITSIPGRTYTWTVSSPNQITSGQGTNSISVFYNQESGSAVTGVTEVISGTGCSASASFFNTTVNEGSNPSVSGSSTVCANSTQSYSTASVVGHTYLWSVSGGTISGSATGNSVSVTWGAAGAGTISVLETVTATLCSNTSILNVTKNGQPTASAGGSQTICSNGTATVSGASSTNGTILWTHNGSGSITGETTLTPVYTATAGDAGLTRTLTMTVTSNNACTPQTATATYSVTVNPLPTAVAGGSQTICSNGTATVSGASSTNGTILWTHNGSGSISGATTLTPVYTAAAGDAGLTRTLTMTVTSNNACTPQTATATYSVTVNPLPTAVAGGSQTICSNGTATISGASSTNGTILWTHNGSGSISGATTLTPVYTAAAGDAGLTRTLTMTVTSNNACTPQTATATYSVTVNPLPTAVAGGSQTICSNGTATVSGASSTNGTILWTHNGSGSITGATTLTPVYTAAAGDAGLTRTLTMTVTSNNACTPQTATATYSVTVNPLPTAVAGGSQTICSNGTATISGASSTNGTILWTHNGSGSISGATTLTPVYTAAAGDAGLTRTLTMTVTSTVACTPAITATATYSVTVNPLPTAVAGGSQTICSNATATVSGASSTNGTILWTHNGSGSITGATTLTPVYTAAAGDAGLTRTLTMTVTSNNACTPQTATATYSVTVNPLPTAVAGGSQTICSNGTATVSGASSTNGTILWTHNGSGSISGETTLTPVYTAAAGDAGLTRTLTMTVTSNNACTPQTATATYSVTVNPLPTAVAGGSQTICSNGTATISGASSTNGTILWTHNGSGSITGATTLTPVYTAAAGDAGLTRTLTMTVTSNNACTPQTATATYSVTVNPLPTASAGGSQTICSNGTATVSGASSTNGTILWTHNGSGSITGETTLTPVYTAAAGDAGLTRTLTMTVTSNNACTPQTATATYSVTVNPLPTAVAGGSQTICSNGTATISGASSTNGTILWTHNGSGSITGATTLTPVYTAAAGDAGLTRTLTMTVTSTVACTPAITATATYSVTVNPLPTASAGGSQTICSNGTATISGASSTNGTILWTHNGSGSITGATTLTPVYTAAAGDAGLTRTLTMTVTSNNACTPQTATATYSVTVNPLPTAVAGGSQTICSNGTATVSGASSTNGTILWTHNGSGSITGATTLTPVYTAAAGDAGLTRTLTMTVSSTVACTPAITATATYSVTVNPLPTAVAGGSQTICSNGTATISGASSTNGTILWTHNGSGSITGATTLTPVYTAAAGDAGLTRTLTMTVTSTVACTPAITATATYSVTVNPLPTAVAGGSQTICSNGTATISGASSTNGTILWTHNGLGSITGATTLTPVYTAAAGDAGLTRTLTMTVTSNNACTPQTATATYSVTVNPLPTAVAGGSQTICSNGTATISGASSTNGTILWTHNGSGSISGATTLTPVYTAAAGDAGLTRTLTMTVTSNNACTPQTATATYSVTVNPLPTAVAGGSQTICSNGTATISGASSTNGTILWTHNGSGSITGATTLTPVYTAAAGDAGLTRTLTMTVTSNNACTPQTATATYSVTVNPLPTAVAGGSQTICSNGTATVSGASSTNGTILWTHNGSGSITGATTLTPVYTAAAGDAGLTRTLTMTVTSNNACTPQTATATYTVVVNAPLANNLITSIQQSICSGTTPTTITGSTATGGDGTTYTYSWESSTTSATAGFTAIPSTNTTNYSPSALTQTTWYRRVVSSGVCANNTTSALIVFVGDTIKPIVVTKPKTVYLDASGNGSIVVNDIENGSTDNCGIVSRTLDKTAFNCSNLGSNTVTLSASDLVGNIGTNTAIVTVLDTIKPTITATNGVVLYISASGTVTPTTTQFTSASADNCGAPTLTISPTTISCSDIGIKTITVTATDVSGNSRSASTTAVVLDPIAPVARPKARLTVYLSASGQALINGGMLDSASSDNCSITSIVLSQSTFSCSFTGNNNVTFTVQDQSGNSHSATVIVTVLDTIRPIAIAQNITVQLDATGNKTILGSQLNNGSSDFCGIASYTSTPTSFNCTNIGVNPVVLTVTDVNGNTRTANATVTVQDLIAPVVLTQNINAYLLPNGTVSITPSQVNNSSTDACGINSSLTTVTPSSFTCSNTGANTVTLSLTDVNGNSATGTATVTVIDTVRPIVVTQNITVQLNSAGNVSITPAQINNGSTDACGINNALLSVSPSTFTCANLGTNTVTLTVTDNKGNVNTGLATVTVQDVTAPVAIAQNINAYLNASGTVTITGAEVNNSSTDACGGLTYSVSPSTFNCSNTGANTVTLTVTDGSSNSSTATATVTVIDTVRPVVITQNLTIQLNSSGNASITASQIDNGSSDACGIATVTVSPSTFTCTNLGANTVTLTVTDNKGNVKTGTATVTVQDVTAPVAIAQNINAYLNASGTVTITGAQVNNSSTDACGGLTYSVSPSTFNCSNTGANTVTLTVTDGSSNSSTATATVTVIDTIVPTVITQNITVQLNSAGTVTITPAQVNNGSTDACGPVTLSLNTSTFTCANLGANTVILTVMDSKGNSKTGFATVTVQDVTAPVAIAQNISVYLNNAGTVTITGAQVNNGSTDACGGLTYSVSPSTFNCSNTGANTVTLTVTDGSSNSSTATATVTVIDTIRPIVVTQNITVQLNSAGTASIIPAQINNGSTDACGINNALLSVSPSTFTCANLGTNTVTLTVTDNKGNVNTGLATVTVQDVTAPVAIAQNINAYLNASGTVTITGAQVNNSSTDACGGLTYSVSPSTFNCTNTGANTVTLTVTDGSSNSSTATATVTVIDTIVPTVITQNITVQLNSAGTVSITPAQVNNGSTDACGPVTLSLNTTTFNCTNVGANTVILTVTDSKGNSKTGFATVTVQDLVLPVVSAQNFTTYLNAAGSATILGSDIVLSTTDACGVASTTVSPLSFNCSNTGTNTVTFTITDVNGNSTTGNRTVTVIDTIKPSVTTQNITVPLDGSGNATIIGSQVNNGSADACGIASMTVTPNTFNCSNIGTPVLVTLTVTDNNGNFRTGTALVTVSEVVKPVVVTKNATIQVNTFGNATLTLSQIDNGSTDNCGIATRVLSKTTFNCSNIGNNTVYLVVTDNYGNKDSAAATVVVQDLIKPTVVSQDATIFLNAAGNGSITASEIDNGSTDNCSITMRTLSKSSFNCSNVGFNTIYLIVTDAGGNKDSVTASINVRDTVRPVVLTKNITVQLDSTGNLTLLPSQVDNGTSDACNFTISVLPNSFTCAQVGPNTVVLTARDASNNVSSRVATVIVQDTVKPVVRTRNINAYLNAAGSTGLITANQVNNGTSDACVITSLVVSPTSFNCTQVGPNTVTLTATDFNNNVQTGTAIVTVIDTIKPNAIAKNISVYLDATGNASIAGSQLNNGSTDNCNIATFGASPNTFTCANVGANTVTLSVTDVNGNVNTATSIVTVFDTITPIVNTQNRTIYLNASGSASITASSINNGSTDACGISTLIVTPNNFNCLNVGTNTVTLTVRDVNNNVKTGTAIVTVLDTIRPNVITQNITAHLDATGNIIVLPSQVNNGSTDACGINNSIMSVSPNSFTCSNIGANTVTLTVTDVNGNAKTGTAIVTIADTVRPVVVTRDITVQLNATGTASITAAQINNGSTDACGINTSIMSVTPSSFTCANIGTNTVTLTVTDLNGNVKTETATVTVADTVRPVVTTQNITVHLDATGNASITGAQVNNGSTDACGIASLVVAPNTFTCSNTGNNTVILTVTDNNGNTRTGTAIVNVLDTVRPVVVTQNATVYLSSIGTASITAAQINNGSSDACGINTSIMSVSPSSFTCSNVGNNTVTLTVTDNKGNVRTGTAIVNVIDTVRPVVTTRNITVQLSNTGVATITPAQVNNGSTDNCGVNTSLLSVTPSSFTCSNIGTNTVVLSVTDVNGNVRTGTAIVTIADTVRPVVITQNITVQLNSSGTASITASQINNGSSDACGINTITASPLTFTCANRGANTVTLTVTDVNGNIKTGTATVTVADTIKPIAIARNLTAYLGSNGTLTLAGASINNGSSDNCGVSSFTATPSSFTCSNLGVNNVTLTVTDASGNFATAPSIVTILDTVRPIVITRNITAQLDSTGNVTITPDLVNNGSSDACGIATIVASPLTFTCANRGANNVTLTITDVNGNVRSGVAVVTVADTIGARVRTKNATVYLLTNGSVGITTAQIDSSSSDNCSIASMTVTPNILRCVNVGNATVTLTVTDVAGNVRTKTATVTVIDTIRPTVTTINRTVFLGSNGSVSITAAQINNGSFDACGVNTSLLSVTPSTFNCSNIGTNTVTLTVVDVNGNSRTGTAVVTVRDTIRPIAIARNITAQLNSLGTVTITGADINNGSTDTCGIASLSVSPNTFTCSNIGANTVTLTVTDGSGNFRTAAAIVTVSDTVRPNVVTQNITAQLNSLGTVTITGAQVNNGSTDACGIASLSVSPSTFTCSNIGTNNVVLTVTDNNGNVRTGTAIVTVADTVGPVVNTQNITVQLNNLGTASITASQINNGSTDVCGINTSSLSVSPSTFTCSNIGNNTVTLSVTDVNGNVRTGTAIVTVADTIRPAAVAQNLTVYLSSLGAVSITGTQVTASSSDICGIVSRTVSPSTFTCSNVGNNNVVLTVTDINGNFVTRSAVVTVLDTVRPVVTTQNITVQLNNLGAATITGSQVNNGSTDACGIATTTVSPSSFTCSNIGNNTVTLTVTDVNGNIRTGTAVVTIADTVRPVVVTQNRTVYLGANGTTSITAAQIDNGSTDACGIANLAVSPSTFNCSNVGTPVTVTLTVTDNNGNFRTGTALVTVLDTVRPNVITQNRTIYLNALGNASITAAQVNNGSNDSCGIASLSLSTTSFTCANVGTNNLTLTVTDNNGNVRTGGVVVTVLDTVRPVVNMVNGIILYLSQTGTINITPSQFNNGSTDICGIASVTISPTTITCSDIGIKAVTLTVTDVNGNVNTGTTNVVVFDPVAPVARPKSAFTAYLSANGQAIINAGLLDSASTDNCAITSRVLSQSVFNCTNTGVNNILFTVQDQSGNSNSANVAVTVLDTIRPVAVVSNQSIYLNASGEGTLTATQVNNNSTDNCGVSSIAISKTSFNCTDLGTSSITFTVTDVNGNIRTAPVSVNVFDTIRPIMRPKQNVIVYLNSTGTASITTTLVDSASTDNCSISTRTLSQSTFNCLNVGLNSVTFSGADATGNVGSRLFTVTVLDTVRPILTTRPATIYINSAGIATLAPSQVILNGTDNCSSLISAVNTSNFTCSNIGTNTVLVTLTDASGNFITGNATVTVIDSIKPIAVTQNRTIYLSASGTASLTAAQVNNGSTDNCGIQSLVISKTSYAAADLGINNITFTVTDNSNNSQIVNVIVTVLDTVRPVVVTQSRTIYLNASGVATVTAAQVNNGSTDNVGITSLILSKTQFSCADRGNNIVTLTATDISNNSTSATATIIVVDTVRPIPVASNQTIYLNGLGVGTLTAAQVNNNSSDNCGITNLTISKTNFSCVDRGVNSTIVTLTATDASANSASTTFTVSVFDTIKPNVVVNNNIDIYLNGSGVATLTTAQVNNGSTDNCGITNLVLSKTSFNATNLGSNIVTLTATDASSNSTIVNVTVNVLDSIRPVVVAQNRTIYLGANGTATVTAAQVNNGSSDNVGVTNLTLSKTDFNCSNIGNNLVTLTARDISNNISSATATIIVLDTIKPTLSANNLTLYLNGVGLAEITTQLANNNSFDNCGIASYSLSKTTFNCSDRGINSNIVTLTAIDNSGNSASTTFTVSVLDTLKPSIIVNNNLNLYLDANGNATLTTTQVNNGSSDNCGISTYSLSKTSFDGTNLGLNVVTFTATDASGNSNSTSVNIIINDTVLPIVHARNRTIYLSATGSALINAIDVDSASTDNVGITTRSINKTLFNCNDAGINFVELIIGDVSGNRNSKIVTVTVLDTILPVVSNVPANITLGYCGANYRPNLPTATDNCGDVTIVQTSGVTPGNIYPVGVTTNTFEVTDKSGNKVTRSFTVTVYPKYVPDSLPNITICSSVPTFALTPANAKGVYTFSGSGVTLDGKSYDPSLSGPGNFNVTYTFIDSSLCATQGNFFVTVNRAPDKPIIERKTSVILQVQQQYNFYQWLRYGQPIAGANNQAYTTTRSGLYSVKVSTKEGCTTESDAFAVGNVGVNQATTQIGFRIYPNPSNGIMNVELDEQSVKETNIKVFDAIGKLVYETSVNTFLSQIDLSKLADGTYYVRLSQEGKTSIKPIVITK
jgi:hypothetical protein